ncbi:MAG: ATP-dependent DNA helicase RecQ [Balneolaceae bacterium]
MTKRSRSDKLGNQTGAGEAEGDLPLQTLKKVWGYDSFRPGQREAIDSVLSGRDTVVIFPTGGGKSLCYQLPALLFEGVTLVISPLVALMEDQVARLQEQGVRATYINSTLHPREVEQRLINARNGMYRLLYLSPERLSTLVWEQSASQIPVSLVAVDEAHCISEWGHDFRPDYREIRPRILETVGPVRWLALTATATPEVRKDLIESLELHDPGVITRGFERPNLQWWVREVKQKRPELLRAVGRAVRHGSGLVYAATRKECERLARLLTTEGVPAEAYHGGLPAPTRLSIQERWTSGELPVVVGTNAFGMGIDKADCRFVIHADLPLSLENYYQEAGRAGRDGEKAWPLLLVRDGDWERARSRLDFFWPPFKELETLYDAVCDELELAVGSEQEEPAPVSLKGLSRRASRTPSTVQTGLDMLERLGVFSRMQTREPRIGIHFLHSREILLELIRRSEDERGEWLDRLLRLAGSEAMERRVWLSRDRLADRLQCSSDDLIRRLEVFALEDRILTIHQSDQDPVLRLELARQRHLPVDKKQVEGVRSRLLEKLRHVKGYLQTQGCREKYLRYYFGETNATDCGHCDRCLSSS